MIYKKKEEYEYSKKRAIFRIGILVLIFFGIYFISTQIIFKTEIKNNSEKLEIEDKIKIIEMNSRGDFNSIDTDIKIEGNIKIENDYENQNLIIQFNSFKITKNKGYEFYLSNNPFEKSQTLLGSSNINIGNFQYKIQADINDYKYITIYHTEKENIVGFALIKNIE